MSETCKDNKIFPYIKALKAQKLQNYKIIKTIN